MYLVQCSHRSIFISYVSPWTPHTHIYYIYIYIHKICGEDRAKSRWKSNDIMIG